MNPVKGKKFQDVDLVIRIKGLLLSISDKILFYLSMIACATIVYDIGFQHSSRIENALDYFHSLTLVVLFGALLGRTLLILARRRSHKFHISEYIILGLLFLGFWNRIIFPRADTSIFDVFESNFFGYLIIVSIFLIELSKKSLSLYALKFNPALLFIVSFAVIILIGTGFLLLPRATTGGLSVTDALFTATSAVCVTGLIVVDTATYFTYFGKAVILVLIQVGGLGIITFTSFFGIFFQENSSFHDQLFMKDLINEERIGDTVKTLVKVVVFTLAIELTGAVFIFFSLPHALIPDFFDRIEFSVFHAISAFCNAGFSTMTNNLYETGYRYNYNFHLIIAFLIIIGGIGYPVILNFYRYIKYQSRKHSMQLFLSREEFIHIPRIISINTKIVLMTSAVLLVAGTVAYYFIEYDHTLAAHDSYGKIVTAFFGSVTPRTAGFNTVDMTQITTATALLYMLLMWIGASPGSTGGGIKTTTITVAILNAISIAKEHERLEIFRREIDIESVKRAFAVMTLSIIVVSLAVFLLTVFDPEMKLRDVAFECFSAFATVGLSVGITAALSTPSKIVIITVMFIGRVGTLTILVALIRKIRTKHYRYPSETIIIT